MQTYYLIDFENVRSAGLQVRRKLTKEDHILIFYTSFSRQIDLNSIEALGDAHLSVIEVPAGHQSLDMHIVTHLGYLIGTEPPDDTRYRIISKDHDYNGIIDYWKEKKGINVSRSATLADAEDPASETSEEIWTPDYYEDDTEAYTIDDTYTSTPDERTLLNNRIMKVFKGTNIDTNTVGFCASAAVQSMDQSHPKQTVYRKLLSHFGKEEGLKYYQMIRSYL